jgi:hypothetical protein
MNMRASVVIALPLIAATGLYSSSAEDASMDLAVVVNKVSVIETVSAADVRAMLLGERPKWPDGKPVLPVQTPPESPEKALQLKAVNKMTDAAVKRYYLLAVFNGKEIALPKDVPSAAALKQFVATNPGAIGCIFASEVDASVKVLKVDGAAPGDPAYKLR